MVTNSFGNRNFMQPMGRLSMHSWWALVFSFWGEFFLFLFFDQFLPPAISLGQKCWPTILEIKNTCNQWVGKSMHSRCLDYFSFKFWVEGVGEDFFHFSFVPSMFPSNAQGVPKFPMCSPMVFQVAPCFNPIYFAQSLTLLTYMSGLKGETLHLS